MVAIEVRDALLKAALKLFAELGSRGATTRRIAQEAGVNEVTLIRHFPNKQVLLHAALEIIRTLCLEPLGITRLPRRRKRWV